MILQRRTDLQWELLGQSVALLDRRLQMAHSLDGAAAAVWLALDGQCRRDVVVDRVVRDGFEVDEVDAVLDSMLDRELLVVDGGLDRRDLIRRGFGAAAAGAVLSIALPEVAAAASAGSSLYTNTPGYSLTGTTGGPGTVDGSGYPQPKIENLVAGFPGTAPASSYLWLSIPSNSTVPAMQVSWTGTSSMSIDLAAEISDNFDPALGEDAAEIAQITANRDAWIAATSIRADFGDSAETSANWLGKAFGPA